ncbi:MAG TPA: ThuA domain-containing protein [Kofleriaceae bacterium]|nr:ThuA domain-containing protein [Kofleriaceae bacterium]
MKRFALALIACAACGRDASAPEVIVFTRTAGFRHDSIPTAIDTLNALGVERGFTTFVTEDPEALVDHLPRASALVFALTTGDVLDDAQQTSVEAWVRAGHGWVGIHSAADTEYDWSWYDGLVGTHFLSHPPGTYDTIVRGPTIAGDWPVNDELYNFRANVREAADVLATIDESTYTGGTMGADHPIAWQHAWDGGRAWYIGLGHRAELYADPIFRGLLADGIDYAMGSNR